MQDFDEGIPLDLDEDQMILIYSILKTYYDFYNSFEGQIRLFELSADLEIAHDQLNQVKIILEGFNKVGIG